MIKGAEADGEVMAIPSHPADPKAIKMDETIVRVITTELQTLRR